ncbi:hypothetical protein [Nesterenkonia marinintestina]|uniref:hypothetical protein n=1 Tax=Nesterenkonia marinintestina TaxID=2979865 RepID=UPI0021C08331|nr:hypothetical protein [Nesterenkonia sp. GX14115]
MHLLPVLTDWWPGGGGQDEGPALREGLEESDITPGIEGFLFTALIVVLLIFIVRDMIRRMRRMKYRAQIEAEADGDEPEFPGEVTAAQISESQLRAREAAAAQRFGAAPVAEEATRRDPAAEAAESSAPEDLEGGRPRER